MIYQSNRNAIIKGALLGGVAAATFFGWQGSAAAQSSGGETKVSGVADIVVTARRKEERNQDVPVAITAFSSERISEMNITSTQSLQSTVPSLTVGPNGQGAREVESPSIRGQSAAFLSSPAVSMYLNEVPLPAGTFFSNQGGPGSFLDLSGVQVLKGPQGTLFGRNTTGGAVLLQPNKPTNRMEGYIQVQGGNYNDREVQAVVNVPVIDDKLLVRFAGEIVDRDGFTKDVNWNKDRDDKHYWTGRLGVTWRPTDKIDNYLMAYNTWSRNNGTGAVLKGYNTTNLRNIALATGGFAGGCGTLTTVPCSVYDGLVAAQDARGPRKVAHNLDDYGKVKTWGVTDTLAYDVSEDLTIRNIISYQELEQYFSFDGDGSLAPIYDNGTFTGRTVPRDAIKQFTEELQLQGSALDKRLDYVLGAFYMKIDPTTIQGSTGNVLCPISLTAACANPGTSFDIIPGDRSSFAFPVIYSTESESYAAYAQGSYDLGGLTETLDGLKLSLGYRYTWDNIDGSSTRYAFQPATGLYRCGNDNSISPTIAGCTFTAKLKGEKPTWTAGLDYKLNPSTLVYGKYSRGYKSGGFNSYSVRPSTRTFGPEILDAYEIGFKSDFSVAGFPVRLNLDVFQNDYDKIQRAAGDRNSATGASGAQQLSIASAKIRGIELESVVKPTSFTEIGVNYSHLDAEYKDYDFTVSSVALQDCSGAIKPVGSVADLSCLPLQYLSPNIVSVFGRIEFKPNMSLFVNYSWTDDQHTEALFLERNQPGERLESYGTLGASFDWKRVAGSNIDLSLFGTNLTDEVYRISNTNVFQTSSVWATTYGEPRMVGARIRYNWGN